jgi:serine/threonine protein kinase
MWGGAIEEEEAAATDGPYDSFLREAARVTDGAPGADMMPLRSGVRLAGARFEIESEIGSGGMGVVYRARDHHRACAVAVKTLRMATLEALHQLRDEFLVLHDLAHPNLVSLGELFDDAGRWFFSMELVEGVDFLRHVRPGGALDLVRLRGALAQLAAGLGFLHTAGKVHRDVKPSNVLCTDQRIVLLDFGLAGDADTRGRCAGTLPYMAPEQHDGAQVGAPADWYAVGVMLSAALTGRLPFSGPEPMMVASKRRGALPVEGPADLVALIAALLDPDPSARPGDDEIAWRLGLPVPRRAAVKPFIGRNRELAALRGAWAAAQHGAATALVCGPSGVGKSALLARFAGELRSDGAVALVGRCHERVAMPYKAAYGIAAALAECLRDDRGARAEAAAACDVGLLPAVFPVLDEIDELARAARGAPTIRDPQQRRIRVFDAFADVIARLAAHAPLVLVIDDLQWADRDGLALLEHVAVAAPPRLLMVAAARDGAVDPAAAWLAAGTRVDVSGLEPCDAVELARTLAGGHAAGDIAREATGHPLHIAELAHHWRQGAGAAPCLDDAIAARTRDFPEDHTHVLALIAIAGALPQAVIGVAAGLDGAALWSALVALRAANLVRTHGPGVADAVEPYHDRVRETVTTRLAPSALVDGHARLAGALEIGGLGADRPDLLAYHLEGAGRPDDAARWAERAADQAAGALAFDRAAELYQRTLSLTAHEPAREASLRARLGDVLGNASRGAPAAEAYLAAAALVEGDEALELRRRAAEQLLRSGRIDDGLHAIDGVLRQLGLPVVNRRAGQRWRAVASLLVQRALLRVRRWRGPPQRTSSDTDLRRLTCCWSAVLGLALVSPIRMAEYQARHLRLALAARSPRHIALGMAVEAGASALVGPATHAHALLDVARSWAAQADDRRAQAYITTAQGTIAFLCGRWRESLKLCEAAEQVFRDECLGAAWEISTVYRVSLTALWHLGQIAELRRRLPRVLDEADRRGDLYAATQLRTVLQPNLCLMDDREPEARAELARAELGLPRSEITMQHWQYMQASALIELYAGAPAKAVELIDRWVPPIRRAFLFRLRTVRVFTSYVRLAARLGVLASRPRDPARLRAAIVRECNGLDVGVDVDAATSSLRQLVGAELAVLAGNLEGAAAGYRGAADGFAALDMALVASVARWRLGELLGGDAGRALVGEANAALSAEGIVRPDRVVAMFAPVPADAREFR